MSWPKDDQGLAAHLRGALSHAYILSGGDAAGRDAAAEYLAAAALCQNKGEGPCGVCAACRKILSGVHPDVHWTGREKDAGQIQVEQIRALRAELYILPNEAEKSVFLVRDAQHMNPSAQNALLKAFEEPPKHVVLVLLADNAGQLLPTLRSRAVTLRLQGEGDGPEPEQAAELYALLYGVDRAAAVAAYLKLDKLEREALGGLLRALEKETVAHLRAGAGLPPAAAERFLRLLDKLLDYSEFNVGAGHIAGALAAFAADPNME